jgi:hypothetical protein
MLYLVWIFFPAPRWYFCSLFPPVFIILCYRRLPIFCVFFVLSSYGVISPATLWTSKFLLLLPLALQPAVGFGLSSNILPFFPICHQLSPSLLNLSSFFLFSTFVTISFLLCGVVSPTRNLQPGGPGYPSLSGSSPLTCLEWEALPVAYATARIALGIMWPLRQGRDTFGGTSKFLLNINLFITPSALKLSFRVRPEFVIKDFLECKLDQETLQGG